MLLISASAFADSWFVCMGSFKRLDYATNYSANLSKQGYSVVIEPSIIKGVQYYRVLLSDEFSDRNAARVKKDSVAKSLKKNDLWIVTADPRNTFVPAAAAKPNSEVKKPEPAKKASAPEPAAVKSVAVPEVKETISAAPVAAATEPAPAVREVAAVEEPEVTEIPDPVKPSASVIADIIEIPSVSVIEEPDVTEFQEPEKEETVPEVTVTIDETETVEIPSAEETAEISISEDSPVENTPEAAESDASSIIVVIPEEDSEEPEITIDFNTSVEPEQAAAEETEITIQEPEAETQAEEAEITVETEPEESPAETPSVEEPAAEEGPAPEEENSNLTKGEGISEFPAGLSDGAMTAVKATPAFSGWNLSALEIYDYANAKGFSFPVERRDAPGVNYSEHSIDTSKFLSGAFAKYTNADKSFFVAVKTAKKGSFGRLFNSSPKGAEKIPSSIAGTTVTFLAIDNGLIGKTIDSDKLYAVVSDTLSVEELKEILLSDNSSASLMDYEQLTRALPLLSSNKGQKKEFIRFWISEDGTSGSQFKLKKSQVITVSTDYTYVEKAEEAFAEYCTKIEDKSPVPMKINGVLAQFFNADKDDKLVFQTSSVVTEVIVPHQAKYDKNKMKAIAENYPALKKR